MTKEKGLTGIIENVRGFVGNRPMPLFDITTKGKSRIKFIMACTQEDERHNRLTLWRYCVGYDKTAEKIKDIKPGDRVRAMGSLIREYALDEYYKPQLDSNGNRIIREVLLLYKAELADYEKKPEIQPALITV